MIWNWNLSSLLVWTERLALSTFLSPISSPASPILGPASPTGHFEKQTQLTTSEVPVSPTTEALLNKSLPFPSCYPDSEDELRQPSSSSKRGARPLFLRPRRFKFQSQPDTLIFHRQHKREYFAFRAKPSKGLDLIAVSSMNLNLSSHPGK